MATLNDIVQVNITRSTVFPSLPGFGTPGLLAYHAFWVPLVQSISALSDLVGLGVPTSHPIYLWATAVFSQNPRPPSAVIGRRANVFTQTQTLSPQSATQGFVYSFSVTNASNVATAISYTVPGAATLTSVAAAIASLISAAIGADGTSAASLGVITNTAVAGKMLNLTGLPPLAQMLFADTTADPGIAADFAAINAAAALGGPSVSFFGINLDQGGKATILALAAQVEATQQFFIARTSDTACGTAATTDVMSSVQTSAYTRTSVIFAQSATNDYRDGAWFGRMLPYTPGTATYAHKTLSGIAADTLASSEADFINGKNGTTYMTVAGINETFESKCGSGDFIDTITGQTELQAALQIAVFGTFTTQQKVPYTDFGIESLATITRSVIKARTAKKPGDFSFLAASPEPLVTVPLAANVTGSDKSARILKNITFAAKIAGAIHRAVINGNISV